MNGAPPAAATRTGALGALQGLCALLPAAVLAWPTADALLAHDLTPRATGFGVAALCALPAAALLVLRGAAPRLRGLGLLLAPLAAAALWLSFGAPADGFEAARALLAWVLFVALALCGASLGEDGARVLARGAAALALAFALSGHDAPHAGALGNAGVTSEAATLGAAAGLVLLARDRWWGRVLGGLAVAGFLAHALRAPVLAGALSLAAGAAALALASRGRARALAGAVALAAVAVAAGPVVLHAAAPERAAQERAAPAAQEPAAPAAVEASPAGGGAVRARVLVASLRMLAAHPLAGVGPGQFAAAFPPYRDPAEIELSSHGRALDAETEVEHAHDDWLQPALEGGVLVGLAWVAFLVLALRAAWRALVHGSTAAAALGAGVVALAVHALARAPFTADAASASLFAAAAGALLAGPPRPETRVARRFVALSAALLLAVLAPSAWRLARHGLALQGLEQAEGDPARAERAVREALAAEPDSVVARSLAARLAEAHGEAPPAVAARWEDVLALRPHRVEALVQLGIARARAGDAAAARAAAERALALDPGNPAALQNMAALRLHAGELAQGLALLDRLPAARAPSAAWLRGMGARLALSGLEPESEALFARADPALAARTPEQCWALSKAARLAGDDALADGWEARAHRAWADQHARAGRFADAVRSLRQDLRLCTERPGPPPARVRLALAAALDGAGRADEARAELEGLARTPRDVEALPGWARARLQAAGLVP